MALSEREIETASRLKKIFMPYAVERANDLLARGGKLVYYTTAENAVSIASTKKVWMRSTQCMADFMEVRHGVDNLIKFFQEDERKQAFLNALNECHEGAAEEAINLFDAWLQTVETETYIACFSEHDVSEDKIGRLSMWRAFGSGAVGVALVLNLEPFLGQSDALKAYSSPVSYFTEDEFYKEFLRIVKGVKAEQEFLRTKPRDHIVGMVFQRTFVC